MRSINPSRRVSAFVIIRAADACSPSGRFRNTPGTSNRRGAGRPGGRRCRRDRRRTTRRALWRWRCRAINGAISSAKRRSRSRPRARPSRSRRGATAAAGLTPRNAQALAGMAPGPALGPRLRRKNWRHRRGNFRRGWSYGPESLPGLEVMCLMFAAFQRVAPQEDIGIDLHDAYQKALAMHEAQKRGGG